MAAVSRSNAGYLHFMASGRTTSFVALVAPKRLAEGAAIRCPGRFAAVPGGGTAYPAAIGATGKNAPPDQTPNQPSRSVPMSTRR